MHQEDSILSTMHHIFTYRVTLIMEVGGVSVLCDEIWW